MQERKASLEEPHKSRWKMVLAWTNLLVVETE